MRKILERLFPKSVEGIREDGYAIGYAKGDGDGYSKGVQEAGGMAVEMGEVIKSTLADPIRIGWAYKRSVDGFGKFTPNHFYAACKIAAGYKPEELPE